MFDNLSFERSVRPLLKEYCLECHSTEKHKGDLDLERFTSLEEIRKHPKIWQGVVEQLALNEMPPKDEPQPTALVRQQLMDWVNGVLEDIALSRSGDPGPVVLRRLSNAEYTYTLRDLTGVETLTPAREFPVDSAAGEGFMNVGNALVMSPSLITKYLDAAKEIAAHAILLPDGIRFSPSTTRRDWTEEIVSEIRNFYRGFTEARGGDKVNLQGIVFETNEGGRIPLERYLAASLELRDRGGAREAALEEIAAKGGLSPKYLRIVLAMFQSSETSLVLDPLRVRWRAARVEDAPELAAEIGAWQKALWKFSSVGHIGKAGGPKAWLEPVNPLTARQEIRFKIPPAAGATESTMLYLVTNDAGDGNEGDTMVWEAPRFVAPGRPDLLLRDVRETTRELTRLRGQIFETTAQALRAADRIASDSKHLDLARLAAAEGVAPEVLTAWLDYLGLGHSGTAAIDSHFTNALRNSAGYDFVNGWGLPETPLVVANSTGQAVRIPGNLKPHSLAMHPSPKLQVAVGWRSPVEARMRIEARIQHAHPECGNGIAWTLELRQGTTRRRLANGTAQGAVVRLAGPIENVVVRAGDVISLRIGAREGNHSCDLTAVDLTLTSSGPEPREWDLAKDVSPDILSGNPHADRFGHEGVWHFYSEPDASSGETAPAVPPGSLLGQWLAASSSEERNRLAEALQRLLTSAPPANPEGPDAKLHHQLSSLGGPLLRRLAPSTKAGGASTTAEGAVASDWGLDPAQFGRGAARGSSGAADLVVNAPDVIELRLPAELVTGTEFVASAVLDSNSGGEGSVQIQVLDKKPARPTGLLPSAATVTNASGPWTSDNRRILHATPILVKDESQSRIRVLQTFDSFREIFPAALCYSKIVPVDEVVTLTLYHREDAHLGRLMLDENQNAALDRLWDELHYVSQDALTLVDAYEQLWQYATQDADPKVFEPLREPIQQRAAAFRRRLVETEPRHVESVLEFAGRAYRRPLNPSEKSELEALYQKLRVQELPHEEAIRLLLARVLVAPAFLYRAETPGPGMESAPVNDWELASRLSYFLWSSLPDAELRDLAAEGRLRDSDVLAGQLQRMLRDPRVRRMAIEFGCAWLHIHGFDELDEKSERHFPEFIGLRDDMYEESIRFFTDLFQRDGSVLEILDADYAFLNAALAKHYGIPGPPGDDWQRVEGVKKFSRGGILAQAATLAKQSGASRTSPILRGNWVAEVLLGEKLPRPPKGVPQLPEDESTETLTMRQLTEKHSSDPKCSGCHQRIDPYGFSLEEFDAIGRHRDRDLGGRPIETRAKAMDGAEFAGLDGLRGYLLDERRDAFLRQFCRKLLGYSLGRGVMLSDGPLISEMLAQLNSRDYRISAALEAIARSKQFREIRGKEMASEE